MEIDIAKINFDKVYKLYKKIINIEEYFHPVKKWTHVLPDGRILSSESTYRSYPNYPILIKESGVIEFPEILKDLVKRCIEDGATQIQFKCVDEKGAYSYPDYKIEEIISQ